jgi:hypothetical protein
MWFFFTQIASFIEFPLSNSIKQFVCFGGFFFGETLGKGRKRNENSSRTQEKHVKDTKYKDTYPLMIQTTAPG